LLGRPGSKDTTEQYILYSLNTMGLKPLGFRYTYIGHTHVTTITYTKEEIFKKYNTILKLNLDSKETLLGGHPWKGLTQMGVPVCLPCSTAIIYQGVRGSGK